MMVINNEFNPVLAIHPGKLLYGELVTRCVTLADFAGRSGIAEKKLNEIIRGNEKITSRIAIALESVLETPAHVWLNIQEQYDEAVARKRTGTDM